MAKKFTIKKGLDLNLKGKAPLELLAKAEPASSYAVVPEHFEGLTPKVLVKPGDKVQAGDPLMCQKIAPELLFTSPVAGEVLAVHRGEKRKVLSIEIKPQAEESYKAFDVKDWETLDRSKLVGLLCESGMFAFFRQRPYDRLALPESAPRDIFVTANFTAPLAPDFNYLLEGREADFKAALKALTKLTRGTVYVGVPEGFKLDVAIEGVELVVVNGPHPAGLVGTLIGLVKPINKDEIVWTLRATDLLVIGRFLNTGKVDFSRRIALTGSSAKVLGYVDILPGAKVDEVLKGRLGQRGSHERIIDGDVFTGRRIHENNERFSLQCDQITIIPEGDDVHELFGWALPGFNKFSMSRSYFSWLMPKTKEWVLDARIKGGRRAMIMSNELSKVFALDIYPEFLLKSIIAFNITDMENRGIYEVAPEDFALCEFVDTSKMPLQEIVRRGLDELYKEMN